MSLQRFVSRRRWLRGAAIGMLALGAGLWLAGCQRSESASFHATDISGTDLGAGWSLPGLDGKPRTIADYDGKVTAVFFGFIQCPDVCPTTMAELARVREQLGDNGDRFQVLFVTVDPERDTPEIMQAYLAAFDPTAEGLRGDAEQLADAAKRFKAFYAKVPQGNDNYTMDHSAGLYVFDGTGDIRLYMRYGQPVEQIVDDVTLLMNQA
ncbi:MAG: SCO family protein [Pigmentiphaga sp.]|nr:SCO family protein [Pigmentiphaga sp.]